jgi:hypothetical protein
MLARWPLLQPIILDLTRLVNRLLLSDTPALSIVEGPASAPEKCQMIAT